MFGSPKLDGRIIFFSLSPEEKVVFASLLLDFHAFVHSYSVDSLYGSLFYRLQFFNH